MKCPIKGHDHDVKIHRNITQKDTGNKAQILECPGGQYRWMLLDGRIFGPNTIRFNKPRYGWRD